MARRPAEIEVKFDRPETAAAFVAILRRHDFRARPGLGEADVVAFVPPLDVEEKRTFGVRDEIDLVELFSRQAIASTARSIQRYVARQPGDPARYRFRAHSLPEAREHARRYLGPGADAELE